MSEELHRLFEEFRAIPAPPPDLSDEELIAEIRERAAHEQCSSPPSPPPQENDR